MSYFNKFRSNDLGIREVLVQRFADTSEPREDNPYAEEYIISVHEAGRILFAHLDANNVEKQNKFSQELEIAVTIAKAHGEPRGFMYLRDVVQKIGLVGNEWGGTGLLEKLRAKVRSSSEMSLGDYLREATRKI